MLSSAATISAGTATSASLRGSAGVSTSATTRVRSSQAGKRPSSALNFQNTARNTVLAAR